MEYLYNLNETQKYTFSLTQDGSPTLSMESSGEKSEKMHNEMGAFSETHYLYGAALDHAIFRRWPRHFTFVGLGLGYIELLAAAKFLDQDIRFRSYESDSNLVAYFCNWLQGKALPSEFHGNYQNILQMTASALKVPPIKIRAFLCELMGSGRWQILGDVQETHDPFPSSVICYDPFSRQSSPELWSKEILNTFFDLHASPKCVFSTYASFGELKRTLTEQGFKIHTQKGFGKKRESTLAIRDLCS